ncbi:MULTISPECIES: ADP compounds hydrolase NudE [Rodentibacter]|uniref:ADP compounds hydrolase NudE n=2 Tax=Rodentibacter TaxID=1960084 RepID=A0A1V3JE35_9PAST|nr:MULTISPECIES: ADP compounds hydrolase NudE [Rodentibacter]OOF40554.1 ADP compounds hydrolase NudE [Rodentibacter mrazii]OOF54868.1 ADP compounds hydrolase NudE [Rodentibacter genomosp. 2]
MLSDTQKPLPQILSTRTVAKSQLFEIQAVDLAFGNGEKRTYERFKPGAHQAVMMVPIDGDELLMIREYAVGTERYELGFPKGGVDVGETLEEAANRELKEEIGVGAKYIYFLRTVITSPSYMRNPMHIFIVRDFYPCKLEGDEPEPLELVRFPLNKLDELIANPDFNEARNLTALYALRDYLNCQR